jgi:hypothetical protein
VGACGPNTLQYRRKIDGLGTIAVPPGASLRSLAGPMG